MGEFAFVHTLINAAVKKQARTRFVSLSVNVTNS